MNGDNFHFGDNVTMHGGTRNTGIVKHQTPAGPPTADPALTTDPGAAPQERHRALMAVAGIAATVGAVGQPALEAVNRILGLLGGR